MLLSDILVAILGGGAFWAVAILALRVGGYRLEIRVKPVKRRRPAEPDEHTAFL